MEQIGKITGKLNNPTIRMYPELQDKTVTPTTTQQEITADENIYGLDTVTVEAIQTERKNVKSTTESQTITPSENKFINEIIVEALDLESKTITPTTSQQTIVPTSGKDGINEIIVNAVTNGIDNNIKSSNIKAGVTILGVEGNVEPDKPDQSKTVNPSTSQQVITADTGYELASVTVNAVDNTIDNDIVATNIKSGVNILGVDGSVIELIGQTKTVTPTTSQQTITPDNGYNGITKVTVEGIQTETKTVKSTNNSQTITPTQGKFINEITVQPINLQSKDVTITENGTTTIEPDQGYDGLSDVDVTVSGILDTSDATATASDMASGKTAYVNGQKVTGTMSEVSTVLLSDTTVQIFSGQAILFRSNYKPASPIVIKDANVGQYAIYADVANAISLTADKIKKGVTVLGVTGTYEGLDTSDATATAGDIAEGKTAYVNGQKLTGTGNVYATSDVEEGETMQASEEPEPEPERELYNPVVNLDMTTEHTTGVITNIAGNDYNATITTSNGTYTFTNDGLVLTNKCNANINYALTAASAWTWRITGQFVSRNTGQYQRLFRSDIDAPSCYLDSSGTMMNAKITNASNSGANAYEFFTADGWSAAGAKNCQIQNTDVSSIHEFIFVNDGTNIKLYYDRVLFAQQVSSGFVGCSKLGMGENGTTSYNADSILIQKFDVWDKALTAEQIENLL